MDNVLGTGQHSLAKVSIGRLLRGFGWIPKSSVRATGGINQPRGSRGVLCVLATWREKKKKGCDDGERHCHRDCRRRLPHSYNAWPRLVGIGLPNSLGV